MQMPRREFRENPTDQLIAPLNSAERGSAVVAQQRILEPELWQSLRDELQQSASCQDPLGLLVKYGADVTVTEAQIQMSIREQLQGQVPTPEIFGWTEDGGQTFIYMSLIEGDTLEERWSEMDEAERQAVCEELQRIVKTWRALTQDRHDCYIGSYGKQPLTDAFLESHPKLAGPFQGANATQLFHDACGIDIDGDMPFVFTHSDFALPNILLTPGSNPKAVAIIHWGQAGWYPAYWEHCKARRVRVDPKYFDDALQEEWYMKYLPKILSPVDDEKYYHPWLWFMLSKGI